MAGKNQDYQDYRDDREKLAEIIEAASGITGRLSMPVEKELAELAGRVRDERTLEQGKDKLTLLAREARRILDEEVLETAIPKERVLLKENSEELRGLQEK